MYQSRQKSESPWVYLDLCRNCTHRKHNKIELLKKLQIGVNIKPFPKTSNFRLKKLKYSAARVKKLLILLNK